MMLLRLAWRNLWRNRRRSIIILASIIVGVVAMNFVDGLARGFTMQMFTNQLSAHTAHMQIHARGFNDNRIVQNFMVHPDSVEALLQNNPQVKHFSRRVSVFGLLSSASNSAGVSIVGIEPEQEAHVTTIKSSIVEGNYLGTGAHDIVLSRRLAQTLDIGLGDRVVAMASSLDGKVGSEMFRVVGLYQSASLSFDKMYVYTPLTTTQQMLGVGDRIAEFAVIANDVNMVQSLKQYAAAQLGSGYEVLSYHDLLPSLLSQIEMMSSLMSVFYLLIGSAMIFGIVNTLLMSVFERIREFGILKSIGMKNRLVFTMIETEAFLLGIVGTAVGTVFGVALNLYLSHEGLNLAVFSEGLAAFGSGAILYTVVEWSAVVTEVVVVLFICIIAAVYPAIRAMKLEPVQAIYFV
jgi:putative ABC transport system permease protein